MKFTAMLITDNLGIKQFNIPDKLYEEYFDIYFATTSSMVSIIYLKDGFESAVDIFKYPPLVRNLL